MSYRSFSASVLALIVLVLSCAASACATTCDLMSLGAPCSSMSARAMSSGEPEMQRAMGDAAQMNGAQSDAAQRHIQSHLLTASRVNAPATCLHAPCAEQPALLSDEHSAVAPQGTNADHLLTVGMPALLPNTAGALFVAHDVSTARPLGASSLRKALRV